MKTTTFLTFVNEHCGRAEEAMNFYTSLFPNSKIESITRYAEGDMGGTPELIKLARFTLNGVEYMASENNFKHEWTFSPGVSIFVSCDSEEELQKLFETISSNDGQVMVPVGNYGFSKLFGWCADRYGVSWQINLDN